MDSLRFSYKWLLEHLPNDFKLAPHDTPSEEEIQTRVWEAVKFSFVSFSAFAIWRTMPDVFLGGFVIGMTLSPPIRKIANDLHMLFFKVHPIGKLFIIPAAIGALKFIPFAPLVIGSYVAWRISPLSKDEKHFFTTRPGANPKTPLFRATMENLYSSATCQVAKLPSWWWRGDETPETPR